MAPPDSLDELEPLLLLPGGAAAGPLAPLLELELEPLDEDSEDDGTPPLDDNDEDERREEGEEDREAAVEDGTADEETGPVDDDEEKDPAGDKAAELDDG